MVKLCFEAHRADGKVWAIQHRGRWRLARDVDVQIPMTTVYRGRGSRQPRAYLMSRQPATVIIKAAKATIRHG